MKTLMLADESLLFRAAMLDIIARQGALEPLPAPSKRFRFVPETEEEFTTIRFFLRRGAGDCDNSAPYLAAWFVQQGIPAVPILVWRRGRLHCVVAARGKVYESTWIFEQSPLPPWHELIVLPAHYQALQRQLRAIRRVSR
jgi:hypothetical protein